MRLRASHDAGRARRHGRLALRRRDQHTCPCPSTARRRAVSLTASRGTKTRARVHRAWALHASTSATRSQTLLSGLDLHPAQLPTRYAAVYSFFLESLEAASERLRNFVEKAAKATLVGDVFATPRLGRAFSTSPPRDQLRAVTEEEAQRLTSLKHEELLSGSFVRILKTGGRLSSEVAVRGLRRREFYLLGAET